MASQIDPTKPVDGVAAVKNDLRANLQTAKGEIEALQSGKAEVAHMHGLADLTDRGALAGLDQVNSSAIVNGAVTQAKLAAAAVGTAALADGAVTQAKLAAAAVGTAALEDGGVTQAKLAAAAVGTAALADGGVTQAKLAAGAVGTAALADGGVTQAKLAVGAVSAAKLAAGAVGTAALGDGAVSAAKLAAGAVGTAALADGAVTQVKLAAGAVGASQLQDGIPINMQDQLLSRPLLKDVAEVSTTPSISAGVLTLDLEAGNVFEAVLTSDVTSLNLTHPPAAGRAGSVTLIVRQNATGGRTVAWPGTVRWPNGIAPIVSSAPNAVDVYAFITRDAGATWFGFPAGKDFT